MTRETDEERDRRIWREILTDAYTAYAMQLGEKKGPKTKNIH